MSQFWMSTQDDKFLNVLFLLIHFVLYTVYCFHCFFLFKAVVSNMLDFDVLVPYFYCVKCKCGCGYWFLMIAGNLQFLNRVSVFITTVLPEIQQAQ